MASALQYTPDRSSSSTDGFIQPITANGGPQVLAGPRWLGALSLLVLLMGLHIAPPAAHAQTVYHVTETGDASNDGSSFSDGDAVSLQGALSAAGSDDVIVIAAGQYVPTSSSSDRSARFEITGAQNGLRIYGGWDGATSFSSITDVENELANRDLATNPTILSGDIDANDTTTGGITEDASDIQGGNSYTVVYLDGTTNGSITTSTVLDGLVVTGGRADVYEEGVTPQVWGGGAFCDSSGNDTECSPQITNVTFAGNTADQGGALINHATDGGTSSPQITNVTFSGNFADNRAGALYNYGFRGTSSPQITNSVFADNASDIWGGAVYNYGAFSGSTSSPQITNTTFTRNSTDLGGGAIYNRGDLGTSRPVITNSIFWDNESRVNGDEIENDEATPTISHTLVEGGVNGSGIGGDANDDAGDNFQGDPLFVDGDDPAGNDGAFGTEDDGLRLRRGSPALDTGDNLALPSGVDTDLLGEARIQNSTVSLGAYEQGALHGGPIFYVDVTANGTGDGSSFNNASTLQDALNVAGDGDAIVAATGTYVPTGDASDREARFEITGTQDGLKIYGGWTGAESFADITDVESRLDERDLGSDATILSGNIDDDASTNAQNSYNVVVMQASDGSITANTVIDGFTIRDGNANNDQADDGDLSDAGGGLHVQGSTDDVRPTLRNLRITQNEALNGGGVYIDSFLGTAAPRFSNVIVTENEAEENGGGLYAQAGTGGRTAPVWVNALFSSNQADRGGAFYKRATSGGTVASQVVNTNVVNNQVATDGGAAYHDGVGTGTTMAPEYVNTAFWDNTATPFGDELDDPGNGVPLFQHVLAEDGCPGGDATCDTVLDEDPQFVNIDDPAGADRQLGTRADGLRFAPSAPLYNAGTNAPYDGGGAAESVTTDLLRDQRIQDGTVNIGAYEATLHDGPVFYVYADADGAQDGSSFDNAFTDLQRALQLARNGDAIVVAEGIYTPIRPADASDISESEREATFRINEVNEGIQLYGGWSSNTESFADVDAVVDRLGSRDIAEHQTILSGDIGENSITNSEGIIEQADDASDSNSYNVLTLDGRADPDGITPETVVNGFVLTGGNLSGTGGGGTNRMGAGLFCNSQDYACAPQLSNLLIVGNDGGSRFGGGIGIVSETPDTDPQAQLTNLVVTGNSSGLAGGGMATFGAASPQIVNTAFAANTGGSLGAGGLLIVTNDGRSAPALINTTFAENTALGTGSAIVSAAGAPGEIDLELTNSILWGNAGEDGSTNQISTENEVDLRLQNALVQEAEDDGITTEGGSTVLFLDTDGTAVNFGESTNLDADPLFLEADNPTGEDGVFRTEDDGLRLTFGSPAFNSGDNSSVPSNVTTDLLGEDRIQNGSVSLGAYERGSSGARLVLETTPGAETGTLTLRNEGDADVTGAEVDLGLPSGVSATTATGDGDVTGGTWTVDVPAEGTATVRVDFERGASADPGLLDLTAELDTGSYTIDGGATNGTDPDDATADWALLETPYGSGTALAFDGTEDYLRTGGSAEDVGLVGESFTVEAWIQVDDLTDDNPILGHGDSSPGTNQVLHLITRDNTLLMGFYNNDLEGTATLEEGRWHHAAFVYDAANEEQRIYLDGKLDGTRDAEPFDGSQSDRLQIGRWGGSRYLDGTLDELRIWNEARSEADIQATMHQTTPADTPDLIASYRFDAAQTSQRFDDSHSGTTAYDLTGGRDATFEGDPQWTASGAPLGQESVVVAPETEETIGTDGQSLTATVTSTTDRLTLYRYGDATADVFDDNALPGALTERANLVWGAVNTAASSSVTADLELTYGDVTVPTPAVRLVGRPGPAANWTNRNAEANISGTTATLPGQTSFGEYGVSEPAIYHVDAAATGSGDGTSFADGFTDLQEALDIATEGDVIVIAAGTYTPSARLDSADPRSATFEVTGEQDGLKIYGGFSGDETFGDVSDVEDELDSRDVSANETMLSGNLNDDENDDSGNAYHVLVFNAGEGIGADVSDNITEATVLDGVTVSGGNADSDSSPNDSGGGLFCDGEEDGNLCSPQITNTTFTGNSADDSGGAIYNNGINGGASSPEITNATFTGNSAGDGGAIYNDGTQGTSSPQIIGAVFTGNSADNAGGAIYNHGNSSGASSPQIINATVAGNSADDGGAIYNSAFFDGESSPQLTNAILWGNSATGDGTAIYNLSATPTLSYTLVEDGVEGDGIFDDSNSSTDDDNTFADDPLFADAGDPAGDNGTFGTDDDGLRLQNGSPALDTGDNTPFESGGVAEAVTTDLLGEDRIQNSTVSLGAYERGAAVARLALTATPGAEAHTLRLQNTGGAGVTSAEVDLGLSSGVSVTNNSGDGSVSDGTWTVDVPAEGTATVQIAYERDTSADPGLLDLTATLDTGSYTVEGGGTDASNSDDATADWALLEAPYGPGTALSFDGTEDYLRTGGSAEDVGLVGESFTVEAWVRVDDLTDDNPILGHGDSSPGTNQVLHLITRDNTLLMGFFANDLEGTATLEEGRWHHAAFVYDATDEEQRIYLDGKLDGTRDAEPFAGDQNERLRIGQWDGNQYLDGALDELRIWNEARSEADIQATMHQTIPADTPDLVTSYRFDAAQTDQRFDADHDGTTAYDLTGGRDAAFEGDPQWTTSGAPLGQESLVVEADDTGTVGPTGAALTVTGTDAPVTLYRYGDPSAEVFDDDGIPKEARSNAVWGAVPTGMTDLDADLELTYGDVTVPNPSDVGLAERPRPAQPWTAREEPPSSETFELTSQSEPREFTLYDSEPSILYVDAAASGTGTGSSWDDAFPNLQDGLNAASGLDVIVIAAGTYTPSERLEADDDRTATFEVTGEKDGLQIYGGWSGSESFSDVSDVENALDSRDRSANETILSGDIGTEDDTSDNAYHVFVFNGGDAIGMDTPENITDATVLDGVTITGANGAIAGGGLYCDGEGTGNACSPRVVNTDFTDNSVSSRGGAIYNNGTEGGTSSPQIAGSTFDGNSASDQGGAIFNNGTEGGTSSPQITGSTFTGNSALNRGGAIYNYGDGGTSSPQIIGSVFTDNSVTNGLSTGGAIGNEGSSGGTSSPQIIGSTFTDNAADDAAGAIYNEGSSGGTSSPQITGSTFTENTADFAGGAITSFGSDSVGNEGTISPEITGSTFTGNTSDSGGAIVNSSGEGTPTITNSILWGNSAGDGSEVYNFGPNMSLTLSHTLIQGDTAGISENDGSSTTEDGPIFDEDPLFADADDLAGDDGTFGTDDDGLRLEKGSPAIARGSFAPFEEGGIAEDITTDLAGDPRLFGARPDLGAYTFSDITSTSDDLADASDLLGYLEPNGFAGLVLLRENSATTGGLTFTRTGDAPNDPDGELPGGVAPYTWTVDAELDTSPTYDLLIRTDDIEGIDDFDTLMLYKSEDDGQTWDAVDTLGKFLLDEDRDLVAVQDLTGFSQFALASTDTDNPLPVELAGFEAQRSSEEAVTVQWETLSETNNAGFEVQRATGSAAVETSDSDVSTDESWETIATLDGAGTTDTPQSYQFEDADLPYAADSLAYRLRQIDTDGTASFSEEVTIARPVQAAELLPTYPNPARSTATVRFAVPERQDVRITLYDMLGRRVQTVVRADARGRTEAQLDVSGLASGTYFLRMQTDDGPVDTQRITVVR